MAEVKRSLKNASLLVDSQTKLKRSIRVSGWDNDEATASLKDRPIELLQLGLFSMDVTFRILDGILNLSDPANDAIAFDDTTALTNAGSVYTVNRVFYLYKNGVLYKVNATSDTEVDTMTLAVSSTTDGLYQTLELTDGASGSGVVDVANILYINDVFGIDLTNQELRVKAIVDEDDTGAVDLPNGLGISGNGFIDLGEETEVTISSGVITVDRGYHQVDTESNAASDDLDTINGLADNAILVLRAASSARTVVLKDGTGNLALAGDFSLNNLQDRIVLQGTASGASEICRSNNGG